MTNDDHVPAAAPDDASPSTDEMVEMFKTQSPEETAGWLERLLNIVRPGQKRPAEPKVVKKFGGNSAVRYKGVSF